MTSLYKNGTCFFFYPVAPFMMREKGSVEPVTVMVERDRADVRRCGTAQASSVLSVISSASSCFKWMFSAFSHRLFLIAPSIAWGRLGVNSLNRRTLSRVSPFFSADTFPLAVTGVMLVCVCMCVWEPNRWKARGSNMSQEHGEGWLINWTEQIYWVASVTHTGCRGRGGSLCVCVFLHGGLHLG